MSQAIRKYLAIITYGCAVNCTVKSVACVQLLGMTIQEKASRFYCDCHQDDVQFETAEVDKNAGTLNATGL